MKSNYLLLLFLILAFSACKKDESSNLWTISGEVRMQDAQIPEITSPLEGIKVYLLKAPFTMDTLTNWFTKTDILDSVLTDVNGFYKYSRIEAGDYIVMAADSIAGYRFDWSESPDPIGILSDNTKTAFTMNFITPEPIIDNSGGDFKFVFNNSGETIYFYAEIFRTKRNWQYLHWNWGPVFGWGDWYWDKVSGSRGTTIIYKSTALDDQFFSHEQVSYLITKDASAFWYEYSNAFHLKFSIKGKWIKTIAVDDLKDENIYDIL